MNIKDYRPRCKVCNEPIPKIPNKYHKVDVILRIEYGGCPSSVDESREEYLWLGDTCLKCISRLTRKGKLVERDAVLNGDVYAQGDKG